MIACENILWGEESFQIWENWASPAQQLDVSCQRW